MAEKGMDRPDDKASLEGIGPTEGFPLEEHHSQRDKDQKGSLVEKLKLIALLTEDKKWESLINFLRNNLHVFTWSYNIC